MPDEVTLDVTTIEENVTVETTAGDVVEIQVVAPTGPTGPAGPNSVTIATTSDGTANLALNNVSTASFTAGNSSTTSGEITIFTNGPVFQWRSDTIEYGERGFTFLTTDITSEVNYTLPNASGTIALTTSNVSTATALQNSRNIFGIAFDGTANVTGDATSNGHFASIPTGGQAGHFVTLNGTAPTVVAGRSAWWSDGSGNPSFRNGTGTAVTLVKSSDLGTNVATFLATPTSANLASAVSDETGSGSLVFATSPTIVTPAIRQNNASFTPLALGTYVATFADNADSVSGVQMGNVSSGTSADFRFLIKDNTNHYFAFSQPGVNNTFSLFGVLRSTADFIFNAGGTTRDMVIGTTDAKYLALGTNGSQRLRITSSGEVGIGTTSPSAKSILDLTSTTQGFLPPRMTTTERNVIATPPAGLMIYNTTTNKLNVYTTAWEQVTSA